MKKSLALLLVSAILTLLIAACSEASSPPAAVVPSPTTTSTHTATTQPDVVHMNAGQFVKNTITIKKGASITIVDDVAVLHVIANGTWQSNGNAKHEVETGAPKIVTQFNGDDSHLVGPFVSAGTFHLYCTVHQGMNLTVVVNGE